MGPGPLIAIDVVLLYTLLGPLVLLGIYVLFDTLSHRRENSNPNAKQSASQKTDPALWPVSFLDKYFN